MRRDNGAARTRQYCCGCLACASPMRHECNGNDTRHRTSGLRDPQSVRGALRGATFRCGCVVFLQRCAACRAARRRTPLNGASWKDATMSSRGVIHHRSRAIAMGRPRSGIVGDARWDPRHRMQRRSCAVAPRAGRRWSSLGARSCDRLLAQPWQRGAPGWIVDITGGSHTSFPDAPMCCPRRCRTSADLMPVERSMAPYTGIVDAFARACGGGDAALRSVLAAAPEARGRIGEATRP